MFFKNLNKFIIVILFFAVIGLSIALYSNIKDAAHSDNIDPVHSDKTDPVHSNNIDAAHSDNIDPVHSNNIDPVHSDNIDPVHSDNIENLNDKVVLDRLIAHAGGEVYGIRITNSLQALDNSYEKGFRFFELDFEWTSDGVPVMLHDWGNANWFFNIKNSAEAHTYEEFKGLETILDLTIMDLEILYNWLETHKDAYIITDVKKENIKLLQLLKNNYPNIQNQIIPQIYSFDEYNKVKNLGYSNIILTLYRLDVTDEEILEFCEDTDLLAVTMYQSKGFTDLPQRLLELGIKSYVHTINDYNVYVNLRDNGVFGVYTDYFQPSNWVE